MRETEIIDCLHSSFSISSIILHMITLLSIIITSEESLPYLLKLKEKKNTDSDSDFLLVENVCVLITEQRGIATGM